MSLSSVLVCGNKKLSLCKITIKNFSSGISQMHLFWETGAEVTYFDGRNSQRLGLVLLLSGHPTACPSIVFSIRHYRF